MNLKNYDIIIINSSGGKDSIVSIFEVVRIAREQNFSLDKIVISHQDLGRIEWSGVASLVKRQADLFGLKVYFSKYRNKDGKELTLLDYVRARGSWPSKKVRFCTSEFKRGPGGTVITALSKNLGECKILYVFGFRSAESPAREKKEVLKINKRFSTKKRTVYEWLPVHGWSTKKVWDTIKENDLPYHSAYRKGMPRLSCVFCIFSPFDALVIAGMENPELLEEYVQVEEEIGHSFRQDFTIKSVQDAIKSGYQPAEKINDWIM